MKENYKNYEFRTWYDMVQYYVMGENVRLHGRTNFVIRALERGLTLGMPSGLDVGNSVSRGIEARNL